MSSAAFTPHSPPCTRPRVTTCGWFPGAVTLLCRTLPAGGPCDMPRAHHTGRPERGALLPALRPHLRTCRPAPPLPALPAPPPCPPPHPARPVRSRPRPLLPPRPRFLLSPPSRRTSGSRIPPKSLLSLGASCFVEVTWQPRSPPTGGDAGWVGTGPLGTSGRSRGAGVRSGSEWLGLVASLSQSGSPAAGDFLPGEAAPGPLRGQGPRRSLCSPWAAGALGLPYCSGAGSSRREEAG